MKACPIEKFGNMIINSHSRKTAVSTRPSWGRERIATGRRVAWLVRMLKAVRAAKPVEETLKMYEKR